MEPEELLKLEQKLVSYDGADKIYTSHEARDMFAQMPVLPVHKSEIPRLDMLLNGFEPAEVVVVSGKTGDGKTEFLISLTYNFCLQDKKVLWLPLEKGGKYFLSRFQAYGLPLFSYPITVPRKGTAWIEEKIIEARCKNDGLDVVFIDHLHYIFELDKNINTSLVIGQVMRDIVTMAQKYNVVIFLVAHVGKIKDNEKATKEDIRDSSFCTQEADTVIMVRLIKENHSDYINGLNRSMLTIEKNRRMGRLGKVCLELKGGRLYEYTEERIL